MYNGALASSLALKTAIQNDDRPSAWYEIRYRTNRTQVVGVAKRRFMESALFGLFTDTANVSPEEAKAAYRFLQDHRNQILAYESRWGLNPDGTRGSQRDKQGRTGLEAVKDDYAPIVQYAGLPPATYPKLDWTFDPAKAALLTYLRSQFAGNTAVVSRLADAAFISTNIYIASFCRRNLRVGFGASPDSATCWSTAISASTSRGCMSS